MPILFGAIFTWQKMMSSAVQTNEKRKKPKCQLCRNHGIMDAFTSNHTDCPYVKDHLCELPTCVKQDHPCEMCCITKEKREANKTVIKRQRKQEKGKFEELPLNRNRIRHRQECTKCRNHDQISVLSSKHKKECNWKDCPCPLCVTTSKLRTTSQILTQHNRRAAEAFNQVSKIAGNLQKNSIFIL